MAQPRRVGIIGGQHTTARPDLVRWELALWRVMSHKALLDAGYHVVSASGSGVDAEVAKVMDVHAKRDGSKIVEVRPLRERNLPLTYRDGERLTLTHPESGKEATIVDVDAVIVFPGWFWYTGCALRPVDAVCKQPNSHLVTWPLMEPEGSMYWELQKQHWKRDHVRAGVISPTILISHASSWVQR